MMMDTTERRIAVRDVVSKLVGHKVEDTDAIVSSGLIDSLSVLNLITQLEQKLKLTIPPANLQPDDFDNVDLILETIERVSR